MNVFIGEADGRALRLRNIIGFVVFVRAWCVGPAEEINGLPQEGTLGLLVMKSLSISAAKHSPYQVSAVDLEW